MQPCENSLNIQQGYIGHSVIDTATLSLMDDLTVPILYVSLMTYLPDAFRIQRFTPSSYAAPPDGPIPFPRRLPLSDTSS